MKDPEKARQYMVGYNERNREKRRVKARETYKANPGKFRAKTRAYKKANREKGAAVMAEYRRKNREKLARQRRQTRTPEKTRAAFIRRKYNLTPELVRHLITEQGNACAICRREFTEDVEAHIDHEHGGEVRGILCLNCNAALGLFRDRSDVLSDAIAYLADPPARKHLTPQLRLFEADVYAEVPTATRARAVAAIDRFLVAG